LLRFARNDNIICLLAGGEGVVGGFAANQPLPSRIAFKPRSLRAKRSNLKLLPDNSNMEGSNSKFKKTQSPNYFSCLTNNFSCITNLFRYICFEFEKF